MQNKQEFLARRGLTLSRQVLKRLNSVGILAQSSVSLEHQHLARCYVVRGIESGGAVKDLGRYVTFCDSDGSALPYLHPMDSIAVNGVHAVVVAPVLVRIELFRAGRTCQLLITQHQPGKSENGRRPLIESSLLFRGVNGFMDLKLSSNESDSSGSPVPRFWSRSGEEFTIPPAFGAAVAAVARGANCVGCSHSHFLTLPVALAIGVGAV
ncbi:MAG TPA: hypothetical protein VGR71_16210 [Nitrospira sp.]|nr:hypothetical protein [Nitrospira sp.]